MEILINPKYEYLREYLSEIDKHFEQDGHEIHHGRNVIRTVSVDGTTLCVKRYAQPSLKGRMAGKLTMPKGKRAYLSPLLLHERGFESPDPVAYVKYSKGIFNSESYFVCLYSNYRYSMSTIESVSPDKRKEIIRQFAEFAARLHEEGFLHRDFSSGNILDDTINGRFHFALIDTNSMSCGRPVSIEKGCANFARLSGSNDFFIQLASAYAAARKSSPNYCLKLILAGHEKYLSRKEAERKKREETYNF